MAGKRSIVVCFFAGACVLGVTACGSGGGSSQSKSTTTLAPATTTSPTTTTISPRVSAQQTALAKKSVLQLGDFPAGWSAKPHPAGSDEQGGAAIAACIGAPAQFFNTDSLPHADSDNFDDPNPILEVQSRVAIFPATEDAQDAVAALGQPTAAQCVQNAYNDSFRRQRQNVETTWSHDTTPAAGDGSALLRGTTTTRGVNTAILYASKGPALFLLVPTGNRPMSTDMLGELAWKMVQRYDRAAS